MCEGTDVDIIANFEDSVDVQNKFKEKFSTILILNVLEHTFNPIEILDNAFSILKPGGNCVIIAPTVWPIHDFPIDCFRFNPTFYEEYCKRRSLNLLEDYFEYIGFYNVKFNMSGGSYVLPLPSRTKNINYWYSKIVHRFFNTNGRAMSSASHVAVGAVIQKNKQNYYIN
jgi:SAM-dependent methyltransferase